jgi:hypothetical protein
MHPVECHEHALDQLTTIWLDAEAPFRQAITAATSRIDTELEAHPYTAGESRPGGRRILFAPPLACIFGVNRAAGTATVFRVWLVKPHRNP